MASWIAGFRVDENMAVEVWFQHERLFSKLGLSLPAAYIAHICFCRSGLSRLVVMLALLMFGFVACSWTPLFAILYLIPTNALTSRITIPEI